MNTSPTLTLLDEMDRQQNEVLAAIDRLNERVLSLIATWQRSDAGKDDSVAVVEISRLYYRPEQSKSNQQAEDTPGQPQQREVLHAEEAVAVEEQRSDLLAEHQ